MKMVAAVCNGDEQDLIEGSIAHEPADGNDSFSYESLIFSSQSSAHAAEYRTSELRRGSYGWRPRLTVMINSKDYYGRNCNPHFWFRRGYLWKCEHVRWIFAGVLSTWRTTSVAARVVFPRRALRAPKGEWWFPTGHAVCAKGGVAVHRGDAKWSCPD